MLDQATETFRRESTGPVILHISDTATWQYEAVEELLRDTKPDLLIHTGDMADECKISRMLEHMTPYYAALKRLIPMLLQYAGEVWVVPGNNDDARWLSNRRDIVTLSAVGSEREYHGVRLYLGHHPAPHLDASFYDFALYGHSQNFDWHNPADNAPGKLCHFNGTRHATLIDCATKQYHTIRYREEVL